MRRAETPVWLPRALLVLLVSASALVLVAPIGGSGPLEAAGRVLVGVAVLGLVALVLRGVEPARGVVDYALVAAALALTAAQALGDGVLGPGNGQSAAPSATPAAAVTTSTPAPPPPGTTTAPTITLSTPTAVVSPARPTLPPPATPIAGPSTLPDTRTATSPP